MNIRDVLNRKGRAVITIGPNETCLDAIRKLVDNNIGALPVCDAKGAVLGIVSERDLLREAGQAERSLARTKVKEVMTRDIVVGIPDDDLDYVVSVMSQKGIRHLPVMAGLKLEGMISMRDIIEARLEESRAQVRYLHDYISGGYPER